MYPSGGARETASVPGARETVSGARAPEPASGAGARDAASGAGAGLLAAVLVLCPPAPGAAQECPETLDGPAGAPGVNWGDTLAAISGVAVALDTEPLPTAGARRLLEHGDGAFAEGHHTVAYVAYAAAARADGDGGHESLWKAARAAVDVGEDAGAAAAEAWYGRAESWGRRAAEADPDAPEGHLHLAQALGLLALDAGVRERVRLSEEIRREALATVEADSAYAGGWHVLGRWNRGVMELGGAGRFFARTFLGGEVLGEASWEKAARHLERAAELEPDRIVHRLELAKVHLARERTDEARASLERVLSLPPRDYHDCVYRDEARELIAGLDPD